ncbi:hypothetical protein FRC03_008694 [Tulasnella sp. 419]|nr:hypothetical protein FRC03_008694 [Tulasnella sp. 419]
MGPKLESSSNKGLKRRAASPSGGEEAKKKRSKKMVAEQESKEEVMEMEVVTKKKASTKKANRVLDVVHHLADSALLRDPAVEELRRKASLGYVLIDVSTPVSHGYFNQRPLNKSAVKGLMSSMQNQSDRRNDFPLVGAIKRSFLPGDFKICNVLSEAGPIDFQPGYTLHGIAGQHRLAVAQKLLHERRSLLSTVNKSLSTNSEDQKQRDELEQAKTGLELQVERLRYWPMHLFDQDQIPKEGGGSIVNQLLTMLSSNAPTYQHVGTALEQFHMASHHFSNQDPNESERQVLDRALAEVGTNPKAIALLRFEQCRRVIFNLISIKSLENLFNLAEWSKYYYMPSVKDTNHAAAFNLLCLEESLVRLRKLVTVRLPQDNDQDVEVLAVLTVEMMREINNLYKSMIAPRAFNDGIAFFTQKTRTEYIKAVQSLFISYRKRFHQVITKIMVMRIDRIIEQTETVLKGLIVPLFSEGLWRDLENRIGKHVGPGFGLLNLISDLQFGSNGPHIRSQLKTRGGADALLQILFKESDVYETVDPGQRKMFLPFLLELVAGPLSAVSNHVRSLRILPEGPPPPISDALALSIKKLVANWKEERSKADDTSKSSDAFIVAKAVSKAAGVNDVIRTMEDRKKKEVIQKVVSAWHYVVITKRKDFMQLANRPAFHKMVEMFANIPIGMESEAHCSIGLLLPQDLPTSPKDTDVIVPPVVEESPWKPLEDVLKDLGHVTQRALRLLRSYEYQEMSIAEYREFVTNLRDAYAVANNISQDDPAEDSFYLGQFENAENKAETSTTKNSVSTKPVTTKRNDESEESQHSESESESESDESSSKGDDENSVEDDEKDGKNVAGNDEEEDDDDDDEEKDGKKVAGEDDDDEDDDDGGDDDDDDEEKNHRHHPDPGHNVMMRSKRQGMMRSKRQGSKTGVSDNKSERPANAKQPNRVKATSRSAASKGQREATEQTEGRTTAVKEVSKTPSVPSPNTRRLRSGKLSLDDDGAMNVDSNNKASPPKKKVNPDPKRKL